MNRRGAQDFAWSWVREHADLDFDAFQKAYTYAYRISGLKYEPERCAELCLGDL